MAIVEQYTRIDAAIDGVSQMEYTSIKITSEAGLIAVKTIQKGLSGFTDGGGQCNISITSAIPKGGPEFDFLSALAKKEPHEMTLTIGSKSYISQGFFTQATASQTEGSSSAIDAEWIGELLELV